MKTWCPRCNQGWVIEARVSAVGQVVRVCTECEALWTGPGTVETTGFQDMVNYLRSLGLKGTWADLEELPETDESRQTPDS